MARLLPASGLLLSLLVASGEVAAQGAPSGADAALQVTVGKALLEEGKKLLQEGRAGEALDKLAASARSDPTPETLLALAACHAGLGAMASAWGTYHRAEERARMLGDTERAREAAEQAAAIEPRLARIRVVFSVASDRRRLTLDGAELAQEAVGVALPVDPGQHTVRARSGDGHSFSQTFDLHVAELVAITVPAPSAAPQPVPSPAGSPPAPAAQLGNRRVELAGLVLSAVGGASCAVSLGILFGGKVPSGPWLVSSVATGGAGLLVGGVGLTLYFAVAPRMQAARIPWPVHVAPLVARDGGGLTLGGTF